MISYTDEEKSVYVILQPGYISSISNAFKQFRSFWKILLIIGLLSYVISNLINIPNLLSMLYPQYQIFSDTFSGFDPWFWLYYFISFLINLVLIYGMSLASLKAARGTKPSVLDLFRPFKRFFTVIFSGFLLGLIVGLSSLCFFIPGMFFACRLALVPYALVDQRTSATEAIYKSWEMTSGNFWKVFLLGLTLFCIGLLIALPSFIWMYSSPDSLGTQVHISGYLMRTLPSALLGILLTIFNPLLYGSLYHAVRLQKS